MNAALLNDPHLQMHPLCGERLIGLCNRDGQERHESGAEDVKVFFLPTFFDLFV